MTTLPDLLIPTHSAIILIPSYLIAPLPQTLPEYRSHLFVLESGYTAIKLYFLEKGTFKATCWTCYFEPWALAS